MNKTTLARINRDCLAYIASRPALNRLEVEKDAGMARNTLKDYIYGYRKLGANHAFGLVYALVKYGMWANMGWHIEEENDLFGRVIYDSNGLEITNLETLIHLKYANS